MNGSTERSFAYITFGYYMEQISHDWTYTGYTVKCIEMKQIENRILVPKEPKVSDVEDEDILEMNVSATLLMWLMSLKKIPKDG